MKKTKKTIRLFPKRLYILRETDGDNIYFIPYESIDELHEYDNADIAIFDIAGKGKIKVTTEMR